MNPDDFAKLIRQLASRQPFGRYRIVFRSGESILVRHPEAVSWAGSNLWVHTAVDGERRVFPASSVSEFSLLPLQPKAQSDGEQ